MLLLNLYIHFSVHSAFQNMQAAHTLCTYTPPYHQEMLAFDAGSADSGRSPSFLDRRTRHMVSFLHDRALVGICRWHGRLCLPTVVSGSIPGPI